jgi:hypothetical protein
MLDAMMDFVCVCLYLAACGLCVCAGWAAWDFVVYKVKKTKRAKARNK